MIDFQRDFVDPGGFGRRSATTSPSCAAPCLRPSRFSRSPARPVCPSFTRARAIVPTWPTARREEGARPAEDRDRRSGSDGPDPGAGRGGHDIVKELAPAPGEPVVDKPGKAASTRPTCTHSSRIAHIAQLVVCGVTTEVCVNTTVREANDRPTTAWSSRTARPRNCRAPPGRAGDGEGSGRRSSPGSSTTPLPRGVGHARYLEFDDCQQGDDRSRQGAAGRASRSAASASRAEFLRRVAEPSAACCCSCGSCCATYPDGAR